MCKTKKYRGKGAGCLFLPKGCKVYHARWVVDGRIFTRTTGETNKQEALKRLEYFTHPDRERNEELREKGHIARARGHRAEIERWEDEQPALTPAEAWRAYEQSRSRPKSGARTLLSYEQEWADFCGWLKIHYPAAKELRNVSAGMAEEYAAELERGTPAEIAKAVEAAEVVIRYAAEEDNPVGRGLGLYRAALATLKGCRLAPPKDEQDGGDTPEDELLTKARFVHGLKIRQPSRGSTFNRHLNTLALVWRVVKTDNLEITVCRETDGVPREIKARARLGDNPFAWDRSTGKGIRRIELKKADRPHRRQDLTLEEIATLLKAAEGEMRLLIALGFYTGLRLADCVLMSWGKIDRVNGLIAVRSKKTDVETETRIHPALARIIGETAKTKTGYLMPELASTYASGKSGAAEVSKRVVNLFQSCGISTTYDAGDGRRAVADKTFHSLRHAYITQLKRVGVSLRERQALAGHSSTGMTEYYTHEDGTGALALPDLTEGVPQARIGNQCAGGVVVDAECMDAAEGRFSAFVQVWRSMSADERGQAVDFLRAEGHI